MARKKKQYHSTVKHSAKSFKPKTSNQEDYVRAIVESDVVFCSGPAGTGKTAVAVGLACEHLLQKKVEKIVITRPVVEAGQGLGYLPGSYIAKIQPYLIPVLEEIKLYLPPPLYTDKHAENQVELCPLEYMRGRNFHNSFMILDEAQNATLEQIKMFITRLGRNSTAVINGDIQQTDLLRSAKGGLSYCMEKLDGLDGVSVCVLDDSDIIRHSIISKILNRLS
mgnify:CR=1 FL=1